jgi:hypothetical protein
LSQATTQSAFDINSRDVYCRFDSLQIKWKQGRNAGAEKFAYEFCSIDSTPWWEFPDSFAADYNSFTTDSFGIFEMQPTASSFDFLNFEFFGTTDSQIENGVFGLQASFFDFWETPKTTPSTAPKTSSPQKLIQ